MAMAELASAAPTSGGVRENLARLAEISLCSPNSTSFTSGRIHSLPRGGGISWHGSSDVSGMHIVDA